MKKFFENKDILVTGGCGSIGSEIVKQLIKYNPKRIRVFDNNESGHFYLNQNLKSEKIRNLIGDVRDYPRVRRAIEGVDIVFHAAALKHVDICEYNPFEAVSTNVMGTKNVVDAAIKEDVMMCLGVSTDKAVNPINTMGATKLLSEKIMINAPSGFAKTKFCSVRFGNVLNSAGSVIPIFQKQISQGGPITITSDKMTRFFMDIPEAVNVVLKSATISKGRETFILKMNALKITDLAEVLIENMAPKYGHEPQDIKYKNIGIRPGEKLHETLMTEEEATYMEEKEDMIILNTSLYSDKTKKVLSEKDMKHEKFSSDKAKLLSKEEIKKSLEEKGII
jgi:UDP-N-acetylglucosamine 4,6-dehydratase